MGAAAQFCRVIAHRNDTHNVVVLFAEQRHRTGFLRFLERHLYVGCFEIVPDFFVDLALDRVDLFLPDRFEMGEVEAGALRRDQRAFLLHVITEHIAQRRVHQVRCRVIALDGFAQVVVDLCMHAVAFAQLARIDDADVQEGLALFLRVLHEKHRIVAEQPASIADLAARLGVERGFLEHHDRALIRADALDPLAVDEQIAHPADLLDPVIARKHRDRIHVDRLVVVNAELAGRARAFALRVHSDLEPRVIDREVAFARDVRGQVDRKTVGVVQSERGLARYRAPAHVADVRFEDAHALIERFREPLFLELEHTHHIVGGRDEFGVGLPHLILQRLDEPVEERVFHTELVAVPYRTPDDTPQNITAALQVARAGHVGSSPDQCPEQVDVIVVVHALHDRGEPLEPHAGIDRRGRQVVQLTVAAAVVLHEHEVPDLDVAVAVLFGCARRTARHVFTVVVKNLGAGTAGTGVAHGPEVVAFVLPAAGLVADAAEAVGIDADLLEPDVGGLVILCIDRDPEPFPRQPDFLREKLPGVVNCLLLEVVAETEIAEHFEKGMVARGVAHVLEIVVLAARTHAALAAGRARVVALVAAEEHVLELHHAGIREQQGRVVAGHERTARHDLVAVPREIIQKFSA